MVWGGWGGDANSNASCRIFKQTCIFKRNDRIEHAIFTGGCYLRKYPPLISLYATTPVYLYWPLFNPYLFSGGIILKILVLGYFVRIV